MMSWMFYNRSTRSNKPQHKRLKADHYVEFDLSKGVEENLKEALINLCKQHDVSGAQKLAYLNAIVKLVSEINTLEYGCSTTELFCCLRVGLVHEATQVRAATLRVIRYLLKKEQDVVIINTLQIPYFISRSMDINIRNEIERIQALRLVRRILYLAPKHFSSVLARSLISITNGGIEEKDQAFRVFLAVVSELGVLNPHLLISCGGISVLCRVITTGQSPGITEAVVGVLLRLLSHPDMRSNVSLICLAAPYCELEAVGMERLKEDWDQRFAASKYALLSVLRSFPGVLHFCHPNENSGLKSITNILYVEQSEVRRAVIELFYELLDLPLPTWTDEPDVALAAVDPRRFRDSWKLSEGFVAAEGRTILSPVTSHCLNISETHSALLVYILIEIGLHKALAETIITSDTFICVRAAVLLGALLHMAHSLLPPEICDLTPPLPTLLEHASIGRRQALAAVAILSRMHSLMRRQLLPISLFMDRLLQSGTWLKPSYATGPRTRHSSFRYWLRRQSPLSQLIKDSQVINSKDALAWKWAAVRTTLRSRNNVFRLMQDSDHRLFIKKLVRYFKPSTNQYSRVELATMVAREATLAGCDLINFLLDLEETECKRFLDELMGDVAEQIQAIQLSQSAHDCLFSPKHVLTSCCQKYFLFIGQLSHSPRGIIILRGFNILEKLQELAVNTKHDCYVKLIVSCLDYSKEKQNRKVLANIVRNSLHEITRLYATRFLRILLRTKMSDEHRWVVGLLLDRLNDKTRSVALAALEALHEACEDPKYLEIILLETKDKFINNWDYWLENLGDLGHLLKIRLYSHPSAFTTLPSPSEELDKWIKPGGFAERYAGLVESNIHDSLTRRQRGENGCYIRRNSGNQTSPKDIIVPPHLIGQLVQHDLGLQLLLKRNVFQRFARVIHRFCIEFSHIDKQNIHNSNVREVNLSEEKKFEVESSKLDTILDDEKSEKPEVLRSQKYIEPLVKIRKKYSYDDLRLSTSEKSQKKKSDENSDFLFGFEGRVLKVKAALWALGHSGTSSLGIEQLNRFGIIELITSIAESCCYYSVQAIALYALNLLSTSQVGADALAIYGWSSVRYRRDDHWPVVLPGRATFAQTSIKPNPTSVSRHHRSLSDSNPEKLSNAVFLPKRQRNRSESAVTDEEVRLLLLSEKEELSSSQSSFLRLSQQDAEGYAKIRSLQKHRVPSLSYSSLEINSSDGRLSQQSFSEIGFSSCSWVESFMTQGPSSILPLLSTPSQTLPLTSTPLCLEALGEVEKSKEISGNENPRYLGICLPKKLSSIFPNSTTTELFFRRSENFRSKDETKLKQKTNLTEIISISNGSKLHDIKAEEPSKQNKHCIETPISIPIEKLSKVNKVGDKYNTFSAIKNNSEDSHFSLNDCFSMSKSFESKNKKNIQSKMKKSDFNEGFEYETSGHFELCLICCQKKHTLKNSDFFNSNYRQQLDKVRCEILRHTQRLANPVFYKQSRQILLTLRQQHPDVFQDVCLYSEVSAQLANNTYRIQARRFVQELFFDSSFDALFEEPSVILKIVVHKYDDYQLSTDDFSPLCQKNISVIVTSLGSPTKINGSIKLSKEEIRSEKDVNLEKSAKSIILL